MMAWKDLTYNTYSGSGNNGSLQVVLQYEDDNTITSLKLRTKSWLTKANQSADTYFIFSKDGSIQRICYRGDYKTGGSSNRGSTPYYSNVFTISKSKYDKSYTIPEFWICNDGSHYKNSNDYTDSNGRGYSVYFSSGRTNYKSVLNSNGSTVTTTKYITDGTAPTLYLADRGDNRVIASGSLGGYGKNNELRTSTLYYTTNGKYPDGNQAWTHSIGLGNTPKGSYSKELPIPSGCTKIIAIVWCSFEHGDDTHSGNKECSVTYHAPGGKPTIYLDDLGNNTVRIWGKQGKNGDNNITDSFNIGYRTDYNLYKTISTITASGSSDYEHIITDLDRSCKVYATAHNSFPVGGVLDSTEASVSFNYYRAPGEPGTPVLDNSSKKNGRLTTQQNWKFTWGAAKESNSVSPVKGYWIRIWRWSKVTQQWTVAKTAEWENTTTSYTFNPVSLGFVHGDQIQFEVAAYSKQEVGTKLWSPITAKWTDPNGTKYDLYTRSVYYTVGSAGVVNVKVNTGTTARPVYEWVEGQVWVKVNNAWTEAETVSVKVDGNWVESQ